MTASDYQVTMDNHVKVKTHIKRSNTTTHSAEFRNENL